MTSKNNLETIKNAIVQLPRDEARELQDWLADHLDDQEELSPVFEVSIVHGRTELAQGDTRVFRPRVS